MLDHYDSLLQMPRAAELDQVRPKHAHELPENCLDLWRLRNANTRSGAAGIRDISPAGKLASALECARRREEGCCCGMFVLDSEAAHVHAAGARGP